MKRLLVVRACAIGDFVLNIPALAALENSLGHVEFTLVGYPSTLDLARGFVRVSSIHSIETPPWSELFHRPASLDDFDLAVIWMKDSAYAQSLCESGISNVFRADPFPRFGHAADHLLRTLGLPRPTLPDCWQPRTDEIIVHPSSGSPSKCWPCFGELASKLDRATILLGPTMLEQPRRYLPPLVFKEGNSVRVVQDLTLPQVAHLLRTSRAYIGNDSGITHLAAYLGCPTIALFGPTDPRVWGPIGRRTRTIWKTKLEDISVDEVLWASDKMGLNRSVKSSIRTPDRSC